MANKYGFGEYLRVACEQANHDCLKCTIRGLITHNTALTGGKTVCEFLQRLLLCNQPDEVSDFVQDVVAFAYKEDKKII